MTGINFKLIEDACEIRADLEKDKTRKATLIQQLAMALGDKEQLRLDLAATQTDLRLARRALANPAFADAAIVGSARPAPAGMPAAEEPPLTKEQAAQAYHMLADPKSREEFRKSHKEILGL